MVTIEPIKNQYLTALKERQQIIDKVNEIIKDLNNLNFDDLINLNNKIEQIKTEIVKIENDLNGKVNKNGDTMTGELIANGGLRSNFIRKLDNSGKNVGYLLFEESEKINTGILNSTKTTNNGNEINPSIKIFANSDGAYYGTVTSNYIGENDNSEKIVNIRMANSLPSLVHTVGNEIINGTKIFNENLILPGVNYKSSIQQTPYIDFHFNNSDSFTSRIIQLENELRIIGNTPVTLDNMPSLNINSNELVPANWVISKINEFASKNNLIGL